APVLRRTPQADRGRGRSAQGRRCRPAASRRGQAVREDRPRRVTRAGPSAVAILVLAALALAPPRPASADEALVDLLRADGQVIVMRHAATDRSVGDPPGFRLDD